MQLITKQMPVDFNLFCFGDSHDGTIMQHREGIAQLVDMMHSKYGDPAWGELPASKNYGIHHGDWLESIMVDDPRYDPETVADAIKTPLDQADSAVKDFWPIRKKMIAGLLGNHELKLKKFGNLAKRICKELGIPYGTYTCKVSYTDHKHELIFKHYLTHGRKQFSTTADDPVRQLSNLKLSLKRYLKDQAADCLLMSVGHTHKLLISEPTRSLYLTDDGKKIKQRYTRSFRTDDYIHPDHRWYLNTGSFYRLYGEMGVSGYAEIAGYKPLELGFPVIFVRDREIVHCEKVVLT